MPAEIEVHDHTLTFESIAEVPVGHALRISRKLQVHVERCRPLDNGHFLVLARSPVPLEGLSSVDVAGSRNDVRARERVRVMSPRLANYSALTVDFSLSGVQLELTAPVDVGELIPLELTLPGGKDNLRCQAAVVWCRRVSNRYRAGCRFVNPDVDLYDSIETWLQARLGRLPAFSTPRPTVPPRPVAPLLSPAPAHLVEPHQPIRLGLPTRPSLAHREEVSLRATLRGYRVEQDRVRIQLDFFDRLSTVIEIEGLWGATPFWCKKIQ